MSKALPGAKHPLAKQLQAIVADISQKRWDAAQSQLELLHKSHPFDPFVLFNLGVVYWELGRGAEAIRLYRQAIGADPTFVPAMVNLGNALHQSGDDRESIRYTQMALRREPNNPRFLLNLAVVLTCLGEASDALQAIDKALSISPDDCNMRVQRMVILADLNRHMEALDEARHILEMPGHQDDLYPLATVVSTAASFSDWDLIDLHLDKLLRAIQAPQATVNPMSMSFSFDDPALLGSMAMRLASNQSTLPKAQPRWNGGRITVGYLSPDFREHPVAHMILDVLRRHDRSRVRIVTLSTLPPDDSPLSRAIAAEADEHIDLTKFDDSAAVREIRARGVDVLVDLAGSTKWCRLGMLARRPCQAQILWLGCPCTTGMPFYDAFLVDEVVAPPGYEAYCTEPLVRLPGCYHPISTGLATGDQVAKRSDLGIPDGVLLVGMMQHPGKIRPPFIDRVVATVARHPTAHLLLRIHNDHKTDVLRRFDRAGLPENRVHFAPRFGDRSAYLSAFRLVDLIVDTYPYGGHSTTGEAIMQDAAVLTIRGRCIHSRVAASMLTELGLGDLISDSLDDMMSQLHNLLHSPALLAQWRSRFAAAAATYRQHGGGRLAQRLEDAYEQVLRGTIA